VSAASTHATGRQRNTRQAQAIEQALGAADGFRTAQDLFSEIRAGGERIGLTTVYRHLALLAETDRADVVHTADGEAQYRLCGPRDSSNPDEHHHHIVCRVCGRSVEVSGPEVEAWADRVAASAGFTDITHTVELFGLCPEHS
jgi:Fur family ferric uptake transcriptional regulator